MGEPWLVMIEELARNVNFEDVTLWVAGLLLCIRAGAWVNFFHGYSGI
jgi:hypothetical protein